ncbi:hypothetical protein N0V88_000683 [Collariella sp. IMI 366227]|nr:hypothetical protein N0V88_000683 [Collariella sp. IMI 366227]
MPTLPSHHANAAGYALHPLQHTEQPPSRRLACIAQALNHGRLKDEQSSAQSLAEAGVRNLQMLQTSEESSARMVLSCRHKHRRFGQLPSHPCSRPPAKSASSVRAASAVVDIAILMMGRTTILVCAATPNTASITLSGHHDANAVGRALQHMHSEEQPVSSRHVHTPATPYRELRDRLNAQSASTGAAFARVTVSGSLPTFVVQFTWDPKGSTKDEDKPTSTSRRARYTAADDAKILQLKEQGLSWIAIAKHFPGRSAGAIEVRYHTKLKTACKEKEWEVEEICGRRTQDDGGLELLVKWKGGEKTWEPFENLAETQALDEYERLHGRVTVDTV